MVSRSSVFSLVLRWCAAFAILGGSGCAKQPPTTAPDAGIVTVGVTAKGRDITGLTVQIEIPSAGVKGPVKADAGVFTARNVPGGKQIVRIGALPDRCQVDGGPERTVTVSRERTATVRFVVTCSGLPGLQVNSAL